MSRYIIPTTNMPTNIATLSGIISTENVQITPIPAHFLNYILNKVVTVKRRKGWRVGEAPRDILNAPSYDKPENWETVYPSLKCRIEFVASARYGFPIEFKPTGERLQPRTVMFVDDNVDIRPEDRIFDGDMVWIVEGKQIYYNTVGGIHHYEYSLLVP